MEVVIRKDDFMKIKLFVSVVIPTFNRKNSLKHCLDSLTKQSYKDYEIIVVDDGSTDGTSLMLEKYDVIIVKQNNLGPSIARNTGVVHAKGDIIAFTDSDCIINYHWINQLVKSFSDKVAIVGGMTTEKPLRGLLKYLCFFRENPSNPKYFETNNLAVYKKVFGDVGGFNPIFDRPGYEDVELCVKIKEKGYDLRFNEKAKIIHNQTINLKGWIKQMFKYGYGYILFLDTHKEYKLFHPYLFFVTPYLILKNSIKITKRAGISSFQYILLLNIIQMYSGLAGKVWCALKLKKPSLILYESK